MSTATVRTLRSQCRACPWRDPNLGLPEGDPLADRVRVAAADGDGFVCHARMGPCDGPSYAGLTATSEDSGKGGEANDG